MVYALDIFLVRTILNMMAEKCIKFTINKFMELYRKHKISVSNDKLDVVSNDKLDVVENTKYDIEMTTEKN
jgi:hypothetical protein